MVAGDLIQAQKIMKLMAGAGFETRLCGGSIRNQLWGLPVHDYDLATEATPEQTKAALSAHRIRFHLAGEKHGTVSALIGGAVYELTTLRQDLKTDGRHSEVSYTQNWVEDASRRDFTVNGLYQDLSGKIYDFVNGLADIKERRLRFIGAPATRIREDYLRILRFFRFWAHYEMRVEDSTLAALASERDGLRLLSQERVSSELRKILSARQVGPVLAAMEKTGIFSQLFGEALPEGFGALMDHPSLVEASCPGERRFRLRFFLLMCLKNNQLSLDCGSMVLAEKLRGWRLSAQEVNIFEALATSLRHWRDQLPLPELLYQEWQYRQGLHQLALFPELIQPLLVLWGAFPANQAAFGQKHLAQCIKAFAQAETRLGQGACLDGEDLMRELGIGPGKELGCLLKEVQKLYLLGSHQTKIELLLAARTLQGASSSLRE